VTDVCLGVIVLLRKSIFDSKCTSLVVI